MPYATSSNTLSVWVTSITGAIYFVALQADQILHTKTFKHFIFNVLDSTEIKLPVA